MSSRKLSVGVAALGIAVALAGCGAGAGGRGAQAVNSGPAISPVAADAGGYAAGSDAQEVEPVATDAASEPAADAALDTAAGAAEEYGEAPASTSAAAKPAAAKPAGRTATRLVAATLPRMGSVVTDQAGWILYRFDKDTADPPVSNCSGKCAVTWPPVVVTKKPQLKGVDADLVGTLEREDGTLQVTLAGWPLYYYAKDAKPGQWKGQGVGGTWFVSTKDGKRNVTCLPPGVTAPGAPAPAAQAAPAAAPRLATQLLAASSSLGTVVTDQRGWILYRFDKDKANPPTSNCSGACATAWPPVLVEGVPKIKGVDQRLVGMVRRADGAWQLTLGGWPLYYFAKDVKPGDFKGQGVGGTWFVSTPTGAKNTRGVPSGEGAAAAGEQSGGGYGGGEKY